MSSYPKQTGRRQEEHMFIILSETDNCDILGATKVVVGAPCGMEYTIYLPPFQHPELKRKEAMRIAVSQCELCARTSCGEVV
jgi:hypothetical protein